MPQRQGKGFSLIVFFPCSRTHFLCCYARFPHADAKAALGLVMGQGGRGGDRGIGTAPSIKTRAFRPPVCFEGAAGTAGDISAPW